MMSPTWLIYQFMQNNGYVALTNDNWSFEEASWVWLQIRDHWSQKEGILVSRLCKNIEDLMAQVFIWDPGVWNNAFNEFG